jgi:hypothetical protein
VDGLHPAAGEHVISKKRFSAFWGSHLASLLRRLAVGHVVLAGVQTPNCIRATAFDAVSEDFPAVSVLADATASATDAVQVTCMKAGRGREGGREFRVASPSPPLLQISNPPTNPTFHLSQPHLFLIFCPPLRPPTCTTSARWASTRPPWPSGRPPWVGAG